MTEYNDGSVLPFGVFDTQLTEHQSLLADLLSKDCEGSSNNLHHTTSRMSIGRGYIFSQDLVSLEQSLSEAYSYSLGSPEQCS